MLTSTSHSQTTFKKESLGDYVARPSRRSKKKIKKTNKGDEQGGETKIQKSVFSFNIDLVKAKKGEGSRGGKIIGHTKGGSAIYDHHEAEFLDVFHGHKAAGRDRAWGYTKEKHGNHSYQDMVDHHVKHGHLKRNAKGSVSIDKKLSKKLEERSRRSISLSRANKSTDELESRKNIITSHINEKRKIEKSITTNEISLTKGIEMSDQNVTLAKTITEELVAEFPELAKSLGTQDVDLLKGPKMEAAKYKAECMEGMQHHIRHARNHKYSMKSHEKMKKDMPAYKKACEKHEEMAKKHGKMLGVPESEVMDTIENGYSMNGDDDKFYGHYSDKKLNKSEMKY